MNRLLLTSFCALTILSCSHIKKANALSCPDTCDESSCKPIGDCEGGVGMDMCGCCRECKKVKDEECGGPWNTLGRCADGLTCQKDVIAGSRFNAHGTCQCKELECQKECKHGYLIKNNIKTGCKTCQCKEYPKCMTAPTYFTFHQYYCQAGDTVYCNSFQCKDCCLFHLRCPPNHHYIHTKTQCIADVHQRRRDYFKKHKRHYKQHYL